MANFGQGFTAGALVGAVGAEFVKHAISWAFKRTTGRTEQRKSLVRSDLQLLVDQVNSLMSLACAYYSKPSADGTETANRLRAEMRTYAMRWHAANARLEEIGEKTIALGPLISLRQALTSKLDVSRDYALSIEAMELEPIMSAINKIYLELSSAKFRLT